MDAIQTAAEEHAAKRRGYLRAFAGVDRLSILAPGVLGVRIDTPAQVRIPAIAATVEGSGAVARYLDALPADREVVFPAVISDRLAGMLRRRGFVDGREWSWSTCEIVGVMRRQAS